MYCFKILHTMSKSGAKLQKKSHARKYLWKKIKKIAQLLRMS